MQQTNVLDPLELQRAIVEFVMERQPHSGPVADVDLAEGLDIDVATLRVHVEMLAAEGRLDVIRGDTHDQVIVTKQQRAQHFAPPPHVVAQQRLERIGDVLHTIQDRMNRVLAWAPLVLTLAGGTLGWFGFSPEVRVESTFYVGLFGMMIGIMIRNELVC